MAMELTSENFEEVVLDSKVPVLVDFWSEGCPPCKQIAPVIDELADERAGTAVIGKCNVSENMDVAMKYEIAGVPTLILFKDGEIVDRNAGAVPKMILEKMIDEHSKS